MATETTDTTDTHSEATTQQTDTGIEENVAGALAYLLGPITGVLFYVLERENEFVRFHAAQSIVVFGGFFVAGIALGVLGAIASTAAFGGAGALAFGLLSLLLSLVWFVVGLAGFVLWIYLMVRAYQGETPRVPVAAGVADSIA